MGMGMGNDVEGAGEGCFARLGWEGTAAEAAGLAGGETVAPAPAAAAAARAVALELTAATRAPFDPPFFCGRMA